MTTTSSLTYLYHLYISANSYNLFIKLIPLPHFSTFSSPPTQSTPPSPPIESKTPVNPVKPQRLARPQSIALTTIASPMIGIPGETDSEREGEMDDDNPTHLIQLNHAETTRLKLTTRFLLFLFL